MVIRAAVLGLVFASHFLASGQLGATPSDPKIVGEWSGRLTPVASKSFDKMSQAERARFQKITGDLATIRVSMTFKSDGTFRSSFAASAAPPQISTGKWILDKLKLVTTANEPGAKPIVGQVNTTGTRIRFEVKGSGILLTLSRK